MQRGKKEWAKHWQCDESVQVFGRQERKNEELKKWEKALPRLKEGKLEKVSRWY